MIQALLDALQGLGIEPEPEEIADVVWLAARAGRNFVALPPPSPSLLCADGEGPGPSPPDANSGDSQRGKDSRTEPATAVVPAAIPVLASPSLVSSPPDNSLPFRSPGARALPGSLDLSRSLRPLMRHVPSRSEFVLDEEATARRIAEERILVPVLRACPARWLDVALIFDTGESMRVWQQALQEFQLLLQSQGAFRDVRVWHMDTASNAGVALYTGTGTTPRHPRELISPAGRRLILLVTDCVSPAWYSQPLIDLLQMWGQKQAVALVQMLPQRLWSQTALRTSRIVRARAPYPAAANSNLRVEAVNRRSRGGRSEAGDGTAIPVLTLEPEYMNLWARMLAGANGVVAPGVVLRPWTQPDHIATDLDPEQRVSRFQANASATAFQLACLLAAAPLQLPIMHLVQRTLLPEARQVHLAEVFLGQLLRRTEMEPVSIDPASIAYDFLPGVRDVLLSAGSVPDAVSVQRTVSRYIADRFGYPIDFPALLTDPGSLEHLRLDEEARAFATISGEVLKRLGGRYAEAVTRWGHQRGQQTGSGEHAADPSIVLSDQEALRTPPAGEEAPSAQTGGLLRSPPFPSTPSGTQTQRPRGQRVGVVYRRGTRTQPDDQVDAMDVVDHMLGLLKRALSARGHEVLYDPYFSKGEAWPRDIDRQLREADVVVVLLSQRALQSGFFINQVNLVHEASRLQAGKPLLLTVRLGSTEPLPAVLDAILSPIQLGWNSPQDDQQLIEDLTRVLEDPAVLVEAASSTPQDPSSTAPSEAWRPEGEEFYLERPVDAQFRQAIAQRTVLIFVTGPRGSGKTRLIQRGLHRIHDTGAKVVWTNITVLDRDVLADPRRFYHTLYEQLAKVLTPDRSLTDAWMEELSPFDNFQNFINKHVLSRSTDHLIWVLDDAEVLFTSPYSGEFVRILRSLRNNIVHGRLDQRTMLSLVISGSTDASPSIEDLDPILASLGRRLELEPFTLEQVAELEQRGKAIKSSRRGDYLPLEGNSLPVQRSEQVADVVILTSLLLEQDAVLAYLDEVQQIWAEGRPYYHAVLGPYQVAVGCVKGMWNAHATSATQEAIAAWNPSHVIFCGIGAGIEEPEGHLLGDVVVSDRIVDYDRTGPFSEEQERTYEVYHPSPALLQAARSVKAQDWVPSIQVPRPAGTQWRTTPEVHVGTVLSVSGQRTLKDLELIRELTSRWPKMAAVDMEVVSFGAAAYNSQTTPGFLLVKAIGDLSVFEKNDEWHLYGAHASAAFVVALLKLQPFNTRARDVLP